MVGVGFFLYVMLFSKFMYGSYPYWRIAAQAWCIDEKYQLTFIRQEALYYGLHVLFASRQHRTTRWQYTLLLI